MKIPGRKILLFLIAVSGLMSLDVLSQGIPTDSLPSDPARISVYSIQNLRFGAFTQGAIGGTIIMSSSGIRTNTGDVVLLNMGIPFSEAIFEVEGIIGTSVSIINGPTVTLTGSNGGSMSMNLGSSLPSSPFIINTQPPNRTEFRIGGTLNVGNPVSNPPGSYTGTLFITLIQE